MNFPLLEKLLQLKAFRVATDDEVHKLDSELAAYRREAAEDLLETIAREAAPPARRASLAPAVAAACVALLAGAGAGWLGAKSRPVAQASRSIDSTAAPDPFRPIDKAELDRRIADAIESTRNSRVIYEDILGEGQGAWDSSPRYPSGIVNCILWVDLVIAEAYGAGRSQEEKTAILDRLRYYGGHPGFGLRKHYLPHWLAVEPAPLQELPLQRFSKRVEKGEVRLKLDGFKAAHKYTCPMYRSGVSDIKYEYLSPQEIVRAAKRFPEGFYVLFAVETERYQKLYGATSGPLGLVHGIFLQAKGEPGKRSDAELIVYHASTSARHVVEQPLADYARQMQKKLHRGYGVYALDPAWDYTKPISPDPEAEAIQKCEAELVRSGSRRSAGLR